MVPIVKGDFMSKVVSFLLALYALALSLFTRARLAAGAFLTGLLALAVTAPAYAVDATDLTTPVKAGVESAMTAGFIIAAAILVGFAIYKIVKRFA